jgi:ribosome-associated toxin RatA of RatAB toxin-antitoxin module
MAITRIARSALLPYARENIFSLINDIEAYPQYMDGCTAARILLAENGFVEARLELSKAGIKQSFTTRNQIIEPQTILMELVEGPLQSLSGRWLFDALDADACKVSLDLQFEVDGKLANLAAGKLFESVAGSLVDSLCKRAHTLYRLQP